MKKTILALLICMGILFCCACAEDAQISAEVDWSEAVQVKSSGPDNQQLAEQYVYSISKKPARGIGFMAKRAASMSFDGTQSRIYALLKADVALVAEGARSSTQFIYDAADAYEQTAFTPEDLGLDKFIEDGAFTDEAIEAIGAKIAPDLDMVLDAIMRDCPYEMYWFDKTISIGVDYPGRVTTDGQTISFSGQLVLSMAVSEEFQLDQQPFECNPAFGATAQAVSTRAQNIVAEHAALDDAAKLQAYKDDICAMTSYNFDAPGYTSYGNPWQLLWVFDDDPDTEVVCEGYAKAFQYLCNLSTFQDASVITVSGQMAGGTGAGDHMWNIVRLPDGWNYLVDVTNCDDNSIGWPNELMLATAASGDVANGYAFTANGEQVSYAYDAETRSLYSAGELAVRCIVASGTCGAQGNNLTWTLDSDGTLTISGTGAMANYEDTIGNNGFVTSAPWGEYAASINSVVVSSGVTSIGNSAFSGCGSLTNITIPESVNSIGLCSFEYCSGLTTITIPDDVTSIGSFAFSGCTSLTSIAIPEGVTSIGESAFYGCSNLTGSITIPDGVTSIGSSTFSGCTSLTSIAIPEGVTSIGEYAFQGCSNLTGSITIPDGVTSIGSSTFSGCSNLTSITIPDSVTNIGVSAFWGCSKLTSIAIPDSLTIIDNYAFSGCSSLTSIAIPEGVTSIGISAFYGCSKLTGSITIPNGVTSIGAETFSGCSNLTGITIPSSVTSIGNAAFSECTGMTSITIPSGVTSIGDYAFSSCSALHKICILGETTTFGNSVFSGRPTIYCWEYSDAEGWAIDNGYTVVLLDTLTDSQREMTLPADFRLLLGESRKLDILLFPDDNPEITWVSSDPAVVSVQDGVVTGLSCGTAAISASIGTISDNVVITVFIPAESFELNKQEVWLIAKESLQLSVENILPDGAGAEVAWSSSDTTLATVDMNGFVTTKKPGDVTITATTENGISASCVLHLTRAVTSVTLSPASATLYPDDTAQLVSTAVTSTDTYTNKLVVYTSSDETVATVDDDGLVLALRPGTAIITAATSNEKYAYATINVLCPSHVSVTDPAVASTCTETGLTAGEHCSVCGEVLIAQEIVPALGHDWSEIVYTWSADNKSVTAVRACAREGCGETETETVAATSEVTKQPTCTAKGETTYTSAEFENEAFAVQAKTLDDVPALGHEWGDVVYIWSADDKCVTAARACAREGCDETETETAQYTFALAKAPTDTEMGETAYTATFENTAFDVEKTVADIPALNDMALLKLPAGLNTIDDEAFMGLACEGILIPDGCTSIGSKAFADCSKLVYVRIPAGVQNIAGDAFDGCPLVRIDTAE